MTEGLSYKELQVKAKKLGMEKVIGISSEELKKFIIEHDNESEITMPGEIKINNDGEEKENISLNQGYNLNNFPKVDDSITLPIENETKESNIRNPYVMDTVEKNKMTEGLSSLDKVVQTRGFKNYKHAEEYLKSEAFTKLSNADQEELKSWFEKI